MFCSYHHLITLFITTFMTISPFFSRREFPHPNALSHPPSLPSFLSLSPSLFLSLSISSLSHSLSLSLLGGSWCTCYCWFFVRFSSRKSHFFRRSVSYYWKLWGERGKEEVEGKLDHFRFRGREEKGRDRERERSFRKKGQQIVLREREGRRKEKWGEEKREEKTEKREGEGKRS